MNMKNILMDIKIITMMSVVSVMYSFILNGRYDLIDTLNILLVLTISICVSSILVTYNFEKKYINNLYRYLSVAFFGIGLVSFSYIYLIRNGFSNPAFWGKATRLNMTFSIFESIFLIYSFFKYKKQININRALTVTILLSMLAVYIGVSEPIGYFKQLNINQIEDIKSFFRIAGVLLKLYLFRVIYINRKSITENMYKNFNLYLIFRLLMHAVGFISPKYITTTFIILCCLFRFISDYCILKIMVIEIVRNPQEALYEDLIKTICELEEANYDKKVLYNNYERKTKEEEMKNEILANISHEFKTPVNVIYSAVQTQELKKDMGNVDDITKYNDIIKQNCNRLIRLINNFIDITRFQKGIIKARFKCLNVVEITEDITMSVTTLAKSKGINMVFDTSDEELFSLIDEELYDRVILNILSNAIKYSKEKGNINVTVSELSNYVSVEIKDDGIGISQENLNVIFNKFERIDKSFSRNTEGSGLGLNIAKQIIELHHGKIEVNSEENKGTTVTVKIPKYNKISIKENSSKRKIVNDYMEHAVDIELSDIYI